MTTNPTTQEAQAMQRIRSHINRSAGQHLRALRSRPAHGSTHPVGSGLHTADVINRTTPSLTAEPLLLRTERLHRVDASQLPHGTGVSLGHCRTDMGVCMGHPECADRHCQGHPCNDGADDGFDVPDSERDGPLLAKVLAGYAVFLLGCGWCAWQLIKWLSR